MYSFIHIAVLPVDDGRSDYPEFYKTDDDGEEYIDPYAEGFVNMNSWEYDPGKDPLGPIFV